MSRWRNNGYDDNHDDNVDDDHDNDTPRYKTENDHL